MTLLILGGLVAVVLVISGGSWLRKRKDDRNA